MEQQTDNFYIEKLLQGKIECFAPLVEKYSKQVFSLIVRIVNNNEDAEELTQDTFLKVLKSLRTFHGDSAFSTWLYRIAYNIAISATRKLKHDIAYIEENTMPEIADEEGEDTWNNDLQNARLDYLQQALKKLSGDDRALIMMFYKDNLSMNEISSVTGMTEGNVKTKIFRIRKKLLIMIKQMEEHI